MKLRGIITLVCYSFRRIFRGQQEMEVLQRDVALMQEDIRQLQRSSTSRSLFENARATGHRQHQPHLHLGRRGATDPPRQINGK